MSGLALSAAGARDLPMHNTLRSPQGTLAMVVLGLLLALATYVPSVQVLLRVRPLDMWLATCGSSVVTVLAALAYRIQGRNGRAYRMLNLLETANTVGWLMYLVCVSGTAVSFAWAFYFAVIIQAGATGSHRVYNTCVFALLPGALAIVFSVVMDAAGDAGISLLIGAMGTLMYWMVSRSSALLAEALEQQQRLTQRIQDLLVHDERARIARDLHDGVGAELSALLWRARALQEGLADELLKAELGTFMDRVRLGTDELRSVVWALRVSDQSWADLVAHLRGRCMELCAGQVELGFEDLGGHPTSVLPGEIRLQVVRLVQEAVRNAVRHAKARRVEVQLDGRGPVRLVIRDNGKGLPPDALKNSEGGLRNIQQRVTHLGGALTVDNASPGTVLKMELPTAAKISAV